MILQKRISVYAVLLFTVVFSTAAFCSEPQLMPLNSMFTEYFERTASSGQEEFALGQIPSPIPPEIHQPGFPNEGASQSDSEYDMRDPDLNGDNSDTLLTPVQNQTPCGACWTFATYGSLESSLKKSLGLSDADNDYSEDNLKHLSGFEWGPCSGGNLDMSTAYLARHDGPVSETDDPYDPSETSDYCADCSPVRYVDNVAWLPVRADVNDNAYIKQEILEHGGMYTSFYWNSAYYSGSPDYTYYYNGSNNINHAVVIVGWDDNKVVSEAPGNGAFIIRNSWGAGWGEAGYFYISYYDTTLAFSSLGYFDDQDDSQLSFDTIYQYDPLGRTSGMGWGDKVDWGANIFTPQADGQVAAVGFYAAASNMSYEIYIYDDFSGSQFSTLLASKTGSVQYSGYYTVKLDSPVAIQSNNDFSVVMKFDTSYSGYNYPIPLERPIGGYASATANSGESYISNNGTSFSDVTGSYSNTNVCIKAFVNSATTAAAIQSPTPGSALTSTTATFTWGNSGASQYWLWIGTSAGDHDVYSGDQGTNTSVVVTDLPTNQGTLYVRLFSVIDGEWLYNDYTYTASNMTAEIQSPTSGSTLDSTTQTFTWNNSGASQYWLWIGTSAGKHDLYSDDQGTNTSATVSGLPANGITLYVRLWSVADGDWFYNDYTYTACVSISDIQSPTPGSTLNSTSATFTWNNSGASQYWLWVGTSAESHDIYSGDQGTSTSKTVSDLPGNGETLYVRLWSVTDGEWLYNDCTYTASSIIAHIQSPTPGSALSSTSESFTWNNSGASSYWLWVGTSAGGHDIYSGD
ncbi:MAG: hypothetical protein GY749_48645, partial [Desulfobacteraceae bacterium]|nr:hypothetical protein [Desulfobacteraceae bacterium]